MIFISLLLFYFFDSFIFIFPINLNFHNLSISNLMIYYFILNLNYISAALYLDFLNHIWSFIFSYNFLSLISLHFFTNIHFVIQYSSVVHLYILSISHIVVYNPSILLNSFCYRFYNFLTFFYHNIFFFSYFFIFLYFFLLFFLFFFLLSLLFLLLFLYLLKFFFYYCWWWYKLLF